MGGAGRVAVERL